MSTNTTDGSGSGSVANVTAGFASASTSGSQDEVGAVVKTESSIAGDSCKWNAGESCLRPRSCSDCLNVLISSDSCAINPNGECVGNSEYETYVNAQAYYIPNYKYYPSSAYSYCSSSDATCFKCVAEWSGKSSASVSTSDVCTGQDGCICMAACEVTDRVATILNDENCSGGSSSTSGSSLSFTERILVAVAVGASVSFFFYAMIWVLRRYIAIIRRREQAQRSARRAPRAGPQLNLNGWKSLQQKLVETERAQLSREPAAAQSESVADPATPLSTAAAAAAELSMPVEGESAQAYAEQDEPPVMGTALSAVGGPTVVVERGDAYRPPSPSRMNARRA